MRPIDWAGVLREHRVPYVESGPNVKRGELAIKCPFCGSADPSHHMGLNLETGWWSCWRNRAQHSGKSPVRLLMKLLRVPYGRAREIAGLGADYIDPEGFDALAARLMGRGEEARPEQIQRRFLDLDQERDFSAISSRSSLTGKFWDYLHYERGFNGASDLGEDVDVLCKQYRLRAGTSGRLKDRIVLPYFMDRELVTWSGRAIAASKYRYLDLEVEESILPPKETLFNHDAIYRGGKVLVVVEGPFDALKLDFYGKPWGVRSVALSTNSMTEAQGFLLQGAETHFERTIFMHDTEKATDVVHSMRLKQQLAFMRHLSISPVPYGAKDAGELRPRQVIDWAQSL